MQIFMQKKKLKWVVLLTISLLISFFRMVDFVSEAANDSFHMTRIGIGIFGINAFIIELGVIIISFMLVGVAIVKLSQLRLTALSR